MEQLPGTAAGRSVLADRAPDGAVGLRVAVVGGGVSGIAAAWYLRRSGVSVELIERSGGLGGRSAPGLLGSREVTFGGKNIGRHYHGFREFTHALGCDHYEYFGINSSRVVNGEIRTIDGRQRLRSIGRFIRHIPPGDIRRFAYLAARVKASEPNRYLGSRYFTAVGDRVDHRPLDAYFGDTLLSLIIRTMTVRMNGAEPDEVYLGNFGSNLGTLLDSYEQLTPGMGPAFERFAQSGPLELGATVTALTVKEGEVRGLVLERSDGGVQERSYDQVVLATPAPVTARLLAATHPSISKLLEAVRYFPAAVVLAEYERDVFSEDVRALVFDAGEPVSNAGAYGVNDRNVVRYTFSGRAARDALARGTDAESLLALAEERLARFFPVGADRRREFAARSWEHGYCAYAPRHGRLLERLVGLLADAPGLELAGDYVRGASIEACFRSARECAARVRAAAGLGQGASGSQGAGLRQSAGVRQSAGGS